MTGPVAIIRLAKTSAHVTLLEIGPAPGSREGAGWHPPLQKGRPLIPLYGLTLFVSALLLFLVQPMTGKMILPLYGGTPAVWNTCMVFFQALLLAGYFYAHVLSTRISTRRQITIHTVLLFLPFIILPINAASGPVPPPEASPVFWLLQRLLLRVGIPFLVVSTTSPLLQKWFVKTGHRAGKDPYFLYSMSNCGSMLALLGYPLLMEPAFGVMAQSRLWALGYGVLVIMIIACGATVWRARPEPETLSDEVPDDSESEATGETGGAAAESPCPLRPPTRERLWWVFLAFVPSSLMLGVTTHLTTNLAAVPLLWVLPLALYLLTFIIVFARRPLIPHKVVVYAFPFLFLALGPMIFMKFGLKTLLIGAHLLLFFTGALLCHGELVKRRPDPKYLTEFYLLMSVGGVLGGLFNAIVAPLLFSSVLEYPLVVALCCLALPRREADTESPLYRALRYAFPALFGLLVLTFVVVLYRNDMGQGMFLTLYSLIAVVLYTYLFIKKQPIPFAIAFGILLILTSKYANYYGEQVILTSRNFYGVKKIRFDPEGNYNKLIHGDTIHGMQSTEPDRATEPLTYYYPTGPVGEVFSAYRGTPITLKVGIVGLGSGSIACYAKPGETFTFFDIDPAVRRIAETPKYFSYLAHCRGTYKIILGDGRLSLAREPDHEFGVLILDVFSSDAIPVHFLTREALQLYLKKVRKDGLILFHISNRYMDLEPLLGNLASAEGLACYDMDDGTTAEEREKGKFASRYVVMARTKDDLASLLKSGNWDEVEPDPTLPVWTDQYSNVWSLMRK